MPQYKNLHKDLGFNQLPDDLSASMIDSNASNEKVKAKGLCPTPQNPVAVQNHQGVQNKIVSLDRAANELKNIMADDAKRADYYKQHGSEVQKNSGNKSAQTGAGQTKSFKDLQQAHAEKYNKDYDKQVAGSTNGLQLVVGSNKIMMVFNIFALINGRVKPDAFNPLEDQNDSLKKTEAALETDADKLPELKDELEREFGNKIHITPAPENANDPNNHAIAAITINDPSITEDLQNFLTERGLQGPEATEKAVNELKESEALNARVMSGPGAAPAA